MRIYTVHELPGAPLDGAGIVLVKEGFSFPAFAFSWAWLLWHRLWVALGLWIGLTVVVAAVTGRFFGAEAATACSFALQLLLGFEAGDIRRWTLGQRGYRFAGISGGATLEEAERNFFAKWDRPLEVEMNTTSFRKGIWPRPAPHIAERRDADGEVFGLFPKPGG